LKALHLSTRTLLLACALALVAILGLSLLRSLQRAEEDNIRVAHTYRVLLAAQGLHSEVADAQSCVRGFLLSGTESYLVEYQSALDAIPETQRQLRQLTLDNREEQSSLDEMDRLIAARRRLFPLAIAYRRAHGVAPPPGAVVTRGSGKILMDRIAAVLDGIVRTEQGLLAQRQAASRQLAANTSWAVGISAVALLLLLTWITYRVEADFAERQRVERDLRSSRQALEASERLMRGTFDNAAVGIALAAPNGRWLQVNQRLCDIVGYSKEELLQKTFQQITHPADLQREVGWLDNFNKGAISTYSTEKRYLRKDGSITWVNLTVSFIPGADGRPERFIGVIEDINARKNAEEALRAANRSLQRSNEDLEQFLYAASHDLQEPLRTVSVFSQLFVRDYGNSFDEKGRRYLDIVMASSRRMQQLIDALLAFSMNTADVAAGIQSVDFEAVFSQAIDALRSQIDEAGATVSHDPLPTVRGNALRLTEVLQNLISNSLKYRRPDCAPYIHIACIPHGDDWLFTVRDDGIGFEPVDAERIFGMFKRLHGGDIPGTGIGLAVVKTVIQRHDGRVWAQSEGEGKGAAFFFTLPR